MLMEFDQKEMKGNNDMYETPKLNRVGEAEEVILGVVPNGSDIDDNLVALPPEFGDGGWDQGGSGGGQ